MMLIFSKTKANSALATTSPGDENNGTMPYNVGLDCLRGLMIIFVVAWHTLLFGNVTPNGPHAFSWSTLGYFNLLLLGVPTFFLISVFLFALKTKTKKAYFSGRIVRLLYAYTFWTILWILIYYQKSFHVLVDLTKLSPKNLLWFFAGAGIGIFYFHFSLILLTLIAQAAVRLPRNLLWLLLIISTAILFCIPLTSLASDPLFCSYWSPFNFLPYAFAGVLLANYLGGKQPGAVGAKGVLLVAATFVLAAGGEWFLYIRSNYLFLHYMRISVVAGAALLFLISFRARPNRVTILVYLSRYALGIYCLQLFVISAFKAIAGSTPHSNVLYTAFVLLLSLFGAIFLRKAFARGIV